MQAPSESPGQTVSKEVLNEPCQVFDSGGRRREVSSQIREALTTSGDIIPGPADLTIRLDPLSAPRRTRALAALCNRLNTTSTRYPGTKLTLRYEVKEHQGTT